MRVGREREKKVRSNSLAIIYLKHKFVGEKVWNGKEWNLLASCYVSSIFTYYFSVPSTHCTSHCTDNEVG
jgi:hypothetical protein